MSSKIILPDSLLIQQIESQFENLKTEFNAAGEAVLLDADAVETIDSAGLQALIVLIRHAQQQGKQVLWQSPSDALCQAANKLGLGSALQLDCAQPCREA
ncbi:MAG: STAS domain-containing protein [Thiotrichales bacterium]|nr:STAS domain-containing protein [Thiotrichales bacterium]